MHDKRHHFTELICWKKGAELRKLIYTIARKLPDNEKFILGSQIRRAAISVTSNIAEGYGRFHYQENIQYCRQSRASIYECEDHLITCRDENYIDQETYNNCMSLLIETRKILDGYINYLSQELKKSKSK